MLRTARRTLTLVTAVATLALAPSAALGDADPASDVLLTQSAFFPYSPPPAPALKSGLTAYTAAAAKAGFPIKVAIISSAVDLGSVAELFGQPQRYATFLATEIAFNHKQLILVVMPQGFGTANIPSAGAIASLKVDASGSDGLTRSAIAAVGRLSAAAGHPLKGAGTSGGSSGGGTSPLVIVGVLVLLVAIGVAVVSRSQRRREAGERPPGDSP